MSDSRGIVHSPMKTNVCDPFTLLQSTHYTTADAIGGALDPAPPPALCQLIQIGESARLVTLADQDAMVDAFGSAERRRATIDRALNHLQCSATELYILVTLFAAESRPVKVQSLARETLANSGALRFALERLEARAAISREVRAAGEPPVRLTSSGRDLALILMYRVLRSVVSRRHDGAEMAETM